MARNLLAKQDRMKREMVKDTNEEFVREVGYETVAG